VENQFEFKPRVNFAFEAIARLASDGTPHANRAGVRESAACLLIMPRQETKTFSNALPQDDNPNMKITSAQTSRPNSNMIKAANAEPRVRTADNVGVTNERHQPANSRSWLKRLLGIKTYVYSDPFLVNDCHLTAHYYQVVRCVESNQIDFVRIKHSPQIGLESGMLPLGDKPFSPAIDSAAGNPEADQITRMFPIERAA